MPYNREVQFRPYEPKGDPSKPENLPGMVRDIVAAYNDAVYKLNTMQEGLERASAGSTTTLVQAQASGSGGGGGGGTTTHNILSATHGDSLTGAVTRGDLIAGNATPEWARLAVGTAGQFLRSNATDPLWQTVTSTDFPHALLSATHTDTFTTGPSQGDLIVGDSTPQWIPLGIGAGGQALLSSGSDPIWGYYLAENVAIGSFTQGSVIFMGAATLAEDNTNFFYDDTNNRLLLGTNTYHGRLSERLEIATSSDFGGMTMGTWSATSNHGPLLEFQRSASASIGSHTLVAANDTLGFIIFRGSDGAAFIDAAYIKVVVDTTPGLNDMPGRLSFYTTADGASVGTERLRLNSAGGALTSNYLRVGSLSTPANVGTGDITGVRINIGNTAFTNDMAVYVANSSTLTAGSYVSHYHQATFTPSADSTAAGFLLQAELRPGGSFNFGSNLITHVILNRWTGSGSNTGANIGIWTAGFYGSTSTAFGTVAAVEGIRVRPVDHFTNNVVGTITNAYGIRILPAQRGGASLSVGSVYGLYVGEQTIGTNNVNITIGTGTTGNWSIFNNSAYKNYFLGHLLINSFTDNAYLYLNQAVSTTGSPTAFRLDGGAHTTLSNAETIDAYFKLARTVQFSGAVTLATQRAFVVEAPTYSSDTGTKTITEAATVAITGRPAAGANITYTRQWALMLGTSAYTGIVNQLIRGGGVELRLDGDLTVNNADVNFYNSGTLRGQLEVNSSGMVLGLFADLPIQFYTNSVEVGRFEGSGEFGIAQATPTALLHIGTSGTLGHIRMDGVAGNPATPTAGDLWYNTTQKSMRFATTVGTNGAVGLVYANVADSNKVQNTTTETDFNKNFTIPANALTAGKVIKIRAGGTWDLLSGTWNMRIYLGGNVVIATGAISNTGGTEGWWLEAQIHIRTAGAGGTCKTTAFFTAGTPTIVYATALETTVSGTSGAVNTTAANIVKISVQYSIANIANASTMMNLSVEIAD